MRTTIDYTIPPKDMVLKLFNHENATDYTHATLKVHDEFRRMGGDTFVVVENLVDMGFDINTVEISFRHILLDKLFSEIKVELREVDIIGDTKEIVAELVLAEMSRKYGMYTDSVQYTVTGEYPDLTFSATDKNLVFLGSVSATVKPALQRRVELVTLGDYSLDGVDYVLELKEVALPRSAPTYPKHEILVTDGFSADDDIMMTNWSPYNGENSILARYHVVNDNYSHQTTVLGAHTMVCGGNNQRYFFYQRSTPYNWKHSDGYQKSQYAFRGWMEEPYTRYISKYARVYYTGNGFQAFSMTERASSHAALPSTRCTWNNRAQAWIRQYEGKLSFWTLTHATNGSWVKATPAGELVTADEVTGMFITGMATYDSETKGHKQLLTTSTWIKDGIFYEWDTETLEAVKLTVDVSGCEEILGRALRFTGTAKMLYLTTFDRKLYRFNLIKK